MHTKDHKAHKASHAETVPNASSPNNSRPRSSADNATGQKPKRSVEVDFCELADGTLVEMIEHPHDATRSLLATWRNGQVRCVEKLECGNHVLVPVPKDTDIIRHVRMATGTEPYNSVRTLLADIMLILHLTLELSGEQLILLGSFVLSTWFVEKLPIAPYVAFVGPPGSGKTMALRILRLLCRRSLLTADISSAAFYEVCDRMTTTLLIDETATMNNRRNLLHLLRTGTTRDFVAIRKGRSFKSYGARAISWTELPDDAALNSRCLLIPMTICKRTDLLAPTDPRILHLADTLQQQLLQFRLTNYKKLALPKISGEENVRPRTRDLFRALALSLGEEKEICAGLLALLRQQESLRDMLSVFQRAVLDSLYEAIQLYPELNSLTIVKLTERVNANLGQKGEPGNLSEKRVSDLLTSLHLTNRTKTNVGYVLWLDRKTREQIHSLARTYGMNAGPTGGLTTKPIEASGRVEAKGPREHGEHREHGKSGIKRKLARTVPAASSRRL